MPWETNKVAKTSDNIVPMFNGVLLFLHHVKMVVLVFFFRVGAKALTLIEDNKHFGVFFWRDGRIKYEMRWIRVLSAAMWVLLQTALVNK